MSLSKPMRAFDGGDRPAALSGEPGGPVSARTAWLAGIGLFCLEALQSVAVLPVLLQWMPAADVALWVGLSASTGLVNVTAAIYGPLLVRGVALAAGPARQGSPRNWLALRRAFDRGGLPLWLLLHGAFVAALLSRSAAPPLTAWATAGLLSVALACRLLAYNRFMLLNGLGWVGRDKLLLALGGAVTLVGTLLLGHALGSALGMALASLCGSVVLLLGASRAERQLRAPALLARIAAPGRRRMIGLLLLNLSGWMNLGTDIVLASHLMPEVQVVGYAFWSKLLTMLLLPLGLYAQIRFPNWVTSNAAATRRELKHWFVGLMVLPPGMLLLYAMTAMSASPLTQLCTPAHWVIAVLACNTALAGATLISGQLSAARGAFGFLWPSVAVGMAAPVLAASVNWAWPATGSFVLGYLVVNVLLLAINARHALRTLQPAKP